MTLSDIIIGLAEILVENQRRERGIDTATTVISAANAAQALTEAAPTIDALASLSSDLARLRRDHDELVTSVVTETNRANDQFARIHSFLNAAIAGQVEN